MSQQNTPAVTNNPSRTLVKKFSILLLLGLVSATLYTLLYLYGDSLRHTAELTYQGDKQLFFIPIIIAFLFSFVHGAFTGHFWEALGLKAASK